MIRLLLRHSKRVRFDFLGIPVTETVYNGERAYYFTFGDKHFATMKHDWYEKENYAILRFESREMMMKMLERGVWQIRTSVMGSEKTWLLALSKARYNIFKKIW